MKLLRMVGLQVLVVATAGFLLAYVLRFPDWHVRPPAPYRFFASLIGCISFLIVAIAWFTGRKSTKQWTIVGWMMGFLLIWWYVAIFLWVNTYGT
jgi:hypothetical protein